MADLDTEIDEEIDPRVVVEPEHHEFRLDPTKVKPESQWRINDEDYVNKCKEEARNNPLLLDGANY